MNERKNERTNERTKEVYLCNTQESLIAQLIDMIMIMTCTT